MKIKNCVLVCLALLFFTFKASEAQDIDALGTYTPYSLYGVGDISNSLTTINKSMGGIGFGVRDFSFINTANVASLTERDTLAFMLNFGVISKNIYLKNHKEKGSHNTVNINNLVISFPIKNKTAMMIGVSPFSSLGYKYKSTETNPQLVYNYGKIDYKKYGSGDIDQAFVGIATNLLPNLAIGAQGVYYFGSLNYHSDIYFDSESSIRTIQTGWRRKTTGWSAEFGAQYSTRLKDDYKLVVGATYRMKSAIRGSLTRYAYAMSAALTDTIPLSGDKSKLTIPAKLGIGVSIRKGDKWMVGLDYERQDWSKATFMSTPGVMFSSQVSQSLRLGMEYIPNRYDIRYYYKRIAYRAGFHLDQSYVKVDGKSVNGFGFTFGMSFPVFRLNNSVNFAVDIGKRGRNSGNLVSEKYVNFIFSLNLHDIWFNKPKYQ